MRYVQDDTVAPRWILAVSMAVVMIALSAGRCAAQFSAAEVGAASSVGAAANVGANEGRLKTGAAVKKLEQGADAENAEGAASSKPAAAKKGDKWSDQHSIARYTAPSVAWWKSLVLGLLVLVWVRSGDWVNRDAQIFQLGHENWNAIVVFPFVLAFVAALLIPNFFAGAGVMALAWAVPFFIYVGKHNGAVEPHQKVFTTDWFRFQVASALKAVGFKVSAEKKADYMKGPPVDLMAMGAADERADQANLITARQSPGYVLVKELVADMVERGSAKLLMDYGQEAITTRHMIDGVWHNGEPRDRESGDVMLAVMKQLAGLDPSERRKKQDSKFGAKFKGKNYLVPVTTQGSKTGERVSLTLRGGKQRDFQTFEQLGMREKLRQQWVEVMSYDNGVILYSALPEGGLTTLTDVGLFETDRLMRDFFSIEDKNAPDREFENIEQNFYDSAAGESPATLVPKMALRYPNVYVVRDLVDEESAKLLMNEVVQEERLLITCVQAKEAPEALLRAIQKKLPHREFAEQVVAVLNTRLIRLLCEECKVGYAPTPDLLKKLGIPAGKVETLFRTPKPDEIQKPCKACAGIGYRGRTGLFELLVVDDGVRRTLLKEPKVDALRKASRAAGMRTLQEEGVLLIAKGTTSLQELSRVLKM